MDRIYLAIFTIISGLFIGYFWDPISATLGLLINEKNVAGLWAVITALITLFGIYLKNLFEEKRQRKHQQHTLIREAYFGGIDYINHSFHKILSIGQTGAIDKDDNDIAASVKFHKLLLVGSPNVIGVFTKLSSSYSDIILSLADPTLSLQTCSSDIEQQRQAQNMALERMDKINIETKEYNDKKKDNPSLWKLYEEQFEQANKDFDNSSKELKDLGRKLIQIRMSLLRISLHSLLNLAPDIFNSILVMRNDIDRKLSKEDAQEIKKSLDLSINDLKANLTKYIDDLESKISELEENQ